MPPQEKGEIRIVYPSLPLPSLLTEEKEVAEDEMVGWHHRLNGHEFEQTPGDGEGPRSLACCSPWSHKESDTTEQLNNVLSIKLLK